MDISKLFSDSREEYKENKLRQIQMIELRILKIVDYILKEEKIDYWLDWGNLIGAVRHKGFIPWDDDIDLGVRIEDYKRVIKILKEKLPDEIFLQTPETDEEYNNYEGIKIRDKYSSIDGSGKENSGIFIEIFPMYKVPDNKFLQKFQILLYRALISSRIDKSNRFKIKVRRKISKFLTYFISLEKLEERILQMYKITKDYKYRHALHSSAKAVDYYFPKDVLFPVKEMIYEGEYFKVPNKVEEYLEIAFGNYMKLPPVEDRVQGHMDIEKVTVRIPNK